MSREGTTTREKSPQSMLKWISKTYDMSPAALARMFQRNARTVSVWNTPDPHNPHRSGIDCI